MRLKASTVGSRHKAPVFTPTGTQSSLIGACGRLALLAAAAVLENEPESAGTWALLLNTGSLTNAAFLLRTQVFAVKTLA